MRLAQWNRSFIYFLICCILEAVASELLVLGFPSSYFDSGEITISMYVMTFLLTLMQICDTVFAIGMIPQVSLGMDPLVVVYNFVMAGFCLLCLLSLLPTYFAGYGNPKKIVVIIAESLTLPVGLIHLLNGIWLMKNISEDLKNRSIIRDGVHIAEEKVPANISEISLSSRIGQELQKPKEKKHPKVKNISNSCCLHCCKRQHLNKLQLKSPILIYQPIKRQSKGTTEVEYENGASKLCVRILFNRKQRKGTNYCKPSATPQRLCGGKDTKCRTETQPVKEPEPKHCPTEDETLVTKLRVNCRQLLNWCRNSRAPPQPEPPRKGSCCRRSRSHSRDSKKTKGKKNKDQVRTPSLSLTSSNTSVTQKELCKKKEVVPSKQSRKKSCCRKSRPRKEKRARKCKKNVARTPSRTSSNTSVTSNEICKRKAKKPPPKKKNCCNRKRNRSDKCKTKTPKTTPSRTSSSNTSISFQEDCNVLKKVKQNLNNCRHLLDRYLFNRNTASCPLPPLRRKGSCCRRSRSRENESKNSSRASSKEGKNLPQSKERSKKKCCKRSRSRKEKVSRECKKNSKKKVSRSSSNTSVISQKVCKENAQTPRRKSSCCSRKSKRKDRHGATLSQSPSSQTSISLKVECKLPKFNINCRSLLDRFSFNKSNASTSCQTPPPRRKGSCCHRSRSQNSKKNSKKSKTPSTTVITSNREEKPTRKSRCCRRSRSDRKPTHSCTSSNTSITSQKVGKRAKKEKQHHKGSCCRRKRKPSQESIRTSSSNISTSLQDTCKNRKKLNPPKFNINCRSLLDRFLAKKSTASAECQTLPPPRKKSCCRRSRSPKSKKKSQKKSECQVKTPASSPTPSNTSIKSQPQRKKSCCRRSRSPKSKKKSQKKSECQVKTSASSPTPSNTSIKSQPQRKKSCCRRSRSPKSKKKSQKKSECQVNTPPPSPTPSKTVITTQEICQDRKGIPSPKSNPKKSCCRRSRSQKSEKKSQKTSECQVPSPTPSNTSITSQEICQEKKRSPSPKPHRKKSCCRRSPSQKCKKKSPIKLEIQVNTPPPSRTPSKTSITSQDICQENRKKSCCRRSRSRERKKNKSKSSPKPRQKKTCCRRSRSQDCEKRSRVKTHLSSPTPSNTSIRTQDVCTQGPPPKLSRKRCCSRKSQTKEIKYNQKHKPFKSNCRSFLDRLRFKRSSSPLPPPPRRRSCCSRSRSRSQKHRCKEGKLLDPSEPAICINCRSLLDRFRFKGGAEVPLPPPRRKGSCCRRSRSRTQKRTRNSEYKTKHHSKARKPTPSRASKSCTCKRRRTNNECPTTKLSCKDILSKFRWSSAPPAAPPPRRCSCRSRSRQGKKPSVSRSSVHSVRSRKKSKEPHAAKKPATSSTVNTKVKQSTKKKDECREAQPMFNICKDILSKFRGNSAPPTPKRRCCRSCSRSREVNPKKLRDSRKPTPSPAPKIKYRVAKVRECKEPRVTRKPTPSPAPNPKTSKKNNECPKSQPVFNAICRDICSKFRWCSAPPAPPPPRRCCCRARSRSRNVSRASRKFTPSPPPKIKFKEPYSVKSSTTSKKKCKPSHASNYNTGRQNECPLAQCSINCKDFLGKLRCNSAGSVASPPRRRCCRSQSRSRDAKPPNSRRSISSPPIKPKYKELRAVRRPPPSPSPKPKPKKKSKECPKSEPFFNTICRDICNKFRCSSAPPAPPPRRRCCCSRERQRTASIRQHKC